MPAVFSLSGFQVALARYLKGTTCKTATFLSLLEVCIELSRSRNARRATSFPLPFRFSVDIPTTVACKMVLDSDGAKLLAYAVSNHYWYQVFLDELPVWGMVGEIVAVRRWLGGGLLGVKSSHTPDCSALTRRTKMPSKSLSLTRRSLMALQRAPSCTHTRTCEWKGLTVFKSVLLFSWLCVPLLVFILMRACLYCSTIAMNGDRLIEVNMTSEVAVPIEAGRSYDLTFSVR